MKRIWAWLQWVVNRPVHRISVREVIFLAVMAIFLFLSLNLLLLRDRDYVIKLRSARLMEKGIAVLGDKYKELGLEVNPDVDNELAGIIGPSSSSITTLAGSLRDKKLSASPDMAALMVELLLRSGVGEGDVVAVGATGSFPALNMAALIAAENVGAAPLMISSVGASSWGATNPGFTWLDMEKVLSEKGIIHTRSLAASIGGSDDMGLAMAPDGPDKAREAISRNGVELLYSSGSLEEAVEKRLKFYSDNSGGRIKAYINVGGGVASLGIAEERQILPGLTLNLSGDTIKGKGVGISYLNQKVPVINLDNIGKITDKYGITASQNKGGLKKAELYYKGSLIRPATAVALALLLVCIYVVTTGRLDLWLHPRSWQS